MSAPNLENNKLFAAILIAGLVAMLSGFISEKIVHSDDPVEDAYPVEVPDVAAGGAAPAEEQGPEPVDDLIAAADIIQGEKLSKACLACHSFDKGGPNKIGPNLWDTYNNKKGHIDGYAYSDALLAHGGVWDVAELNAFLWKPKKHISGTKMNYIGMRKPEDRAAIIKYMQTLRD